MDSRVLLLGIALLMCLVPTIEATITFSAVITRDAMVDSGTRQIAIDIQTTLTSTNNNAYISAASATGYPPTVTLAVATNENTAFGSTNCNAVPAGSTCTQQFTTQFAAADPQDCLISGDNFVFTFTVCDDVDGCVATKTATVQLAERDVCGSSLKTVTADITSFGAFSDPFFTQTKSTYYVNDMVYFPFQIKYRDLTISSLAFDTITVASGSTSSVVIYSSSNTGAGNIVILQTSPVITGVSSGTATAWFGLQISRDDGSPFANTPAALTTYTFSVVFDVEYKNAKRSALKVLGTQLRSQTSIVVSGEQGRISNEERSVIPLQEQIEVNAGHPLGVGKIMSAALVAFFLVAMF